MRILWLSDYGLNVNTGYATVARNMIKQLKNRFGSDLLIDVVAINYFNQQYWEYEETVLVTSGLFGEFGQAQPCPLAEQHKFGLMQFLLKYKNQDYEGVFILQDLGAIAACISNLKMIDAEKRLSGKKVLPKILYFPVDGIIQKEVINKDFSEAVHKTLPKKQQPFFSRYIRPLDELPYFDVIATFTQYGVNQVLSQAKPEFTKNIWSKLKVIPHGIDPKQFYPLPEAEKKSFRDSYFGKNSGKYIVGVINRNSARKAITTAIEAFRVAKKTWPATFAVKPFLYLHMDAVDEPDGFNLPVILQQTDLVENEDYIFGSTKINTDVLNKVYNSIDLYLSTAAGGGWELTVTEAMACKIPCIIPDHTSLGEQGNHGERALMLDELSWGCIHTENIRRLFVHHDQAAELIVKSVWNKQLGSDKERVEAAYAWATSLPWEKICRQWVTIFDDLFGK